MLIRLLRRTGNFIARWPGVPLLVAVGLVVINLILQFFPPDWPVVGWLARTNLFLHLGLIAGFVGMLLGDAL